VLPNRIGVEASVRVHHLVTSVNLVNYNHISHRLNGLVFTSQDLFLSFIR